VVSKAFLISKNTATVDIFLLIFKVKWSVSLIHWSVAMWRAQEPNWLALSTSLSSMCLWPIFRMTSSNSFPVMDKTLIWRKFCGILGSLPGFGKVITFSSFQDCGKCESRIQWLNKWVSSQAYINFNVFVNLRTSQCLTVSGRCFLWTRAELEL
jgi:hypothetical protein